MKLFTYLAVLLITSMAWAQKTPSLVEVKVLPVVSDSDLAAQTIVIFNQNDIESTALAGFYAEKRAIPPLNLIGLNCANKEEINRAEYDQLIAEPVRTALLERGLWKKRETPTAEGAILQTKARFAVVMKGVPLKIATWGHPYPGDVQEGRQEIFSRNEASVDSELSILGLWTHTISGALTNPYWRSNLRFIDTPMTSQLLVCRLDAPSAATVRRIIEDSIAAEQTGLRGFMYVDARGIESGGLAEGDQWLRNASADGRKYGLPVIQDNGPAMFPESYPMRSTALYLGWYSEHIAGALADKNFRFEPGAVAVHIHSFSATSLKDPARWWCAPILEAGAAATMGNVYEPFLTLTPNLDVFAQRLREGFTFAEAAYISQRYLSWMHTFVGDPLYRPFRFLNENKGYDPANEWDAYRLGIKSWVEEGRPAGEAALRDSARRLSSGVIHEGLGLLLLAANDSKAALNSFDLARSAYAKPEDKIRVAVHQAGIILTTQTQEDAAAFLRKQISLYTANPSVNVLRMLLQPLVAPPPPKDNSDPETAALAADKSAKPKSQNKKPKSP